MSRSLVHRPRQAVALAATAASLLALAVSAPATALALAPVPAVRPAPQVEDGLGPLTGVLESPATGALLFGVSSAAADDVWAVGTRSTSSGGTTLAEHWDGSTWTVVPSPTPGPEHAGYLSSVVTLSPTDAWAVGSYQRDSVTSQALIEHWNGAVWKSVALPVPPDSDEFDLSSVTATSANDVWAAGRVEKTPHERDVTAIEHWDGTTWRRVASPSLPEPEQSFLRGVWASAADDIWAVGQGLDFGRGGVRAALQPKIATFAEHWDGASWTLVPTPTPFASGRGSGLTSVSGSASDDVWAVGGGPAGCVAEHWDGSTWSVTHCVHPSGERVALSGVDAVSSSDVWAVGEWEAGSSGGTLVERWNGHRWAVVASPGGHGKGVGLYAVSGSSPNDLHAVGQRLHQQLREHWNGTRWLIG